MGEQRSESFSYTICKCILVTLLVLVLSREWYSPTADTATDRLQALLYILNTCMFYIIYTDPSIEKTVIL